MTTRVKLEIAAAVLGLLLAGIGLHSYQIERENRIRAEAITQVQQDVQKQLAQQVSDLAKQMAERDAAYQQQVASLNTKFQSAQSPAQIASLVAQIMGLKQPIQLVTPPATLSNPNPQPVAQVSTLDAPQVKAYVEQCESCKLERDKLKGDLADTKTKLDVQVKTTASVQKDSDKWEITAKGGTWKQRAWHDSKLLAIGGAVAIVVACATGHCPK